MSKGARAYANPIYLKNLVEAAVEDSDLPICLHLDHGDSFETCKSCIDGGFTSVMIDMSGAPFEENIAVTRQVVEYAHDHGVVVEAELGTLAGIEDEVSHAEGSYTQPEDVQEFVERTGCDSWPSPSAPATGLTSSKANRNWILPVWKRSPTCSPGSPLVLHGASTVIPEFVAECNKYGGKLAGAQGCPEDMILEKAGTHGVCKINIDTDLRLAMTASIRKYLYEHPEDFDPRSYLGKGREAIKMMVAHKMRDVLNSSHRL